jgi:hypothetical protein
LGRAADPGAAARPVAFGAHRTLGEAALEPQRRARSYLTLLAVAGLLAGCHSGTVNPTPPPGSPTPSGSPTTAPVDRPIGFHLQLGAGQSLKVEPPQDDGCPGVEAFATLGPDRYLRLAAYAAGCDATSNSRPGNGRHGVYRTTSDIPTDRLASATKVHTAIGDGVVFTQPYYECTNSCHDYTEPVALITLDHPVDPRYPGLMVYSEKGTIGLDQLAAVLRDQLRA